MFRLPTRWWAALIVILLWWPVALCLAIFYWISIGWWFHMLNGMPRRSTVHYR